MKNNYLFNKKFDSIIKDKELMLNVFMRLMLARTQSMFVYSGLPETIPQEYLERYLQIYGHCIIAEHGNDLYAFNGDLCGLEDVYHNPTQYIVANVALNLTKTYDINQNCILCKNDSYLQGLSLILRKYGTLLIENELTLYTLIKNSRASILISAPDDKTKQSCELFIDKLDRGEMSIIGESQFFDGIKVQSTMQGSAGIVIQFIELQQYIKASCLNEIGLNANYNMKRESLNSAESALNDDYLIPLIDNMLYCRQTFIEGVNKMFGTHFSVELHSAWRTNKLEDIKQDSLAEEFISTENTESTENPEATENTESTENPEATENTESAENPEATENTESTENPEATENTESAENPEATENTESTENPEATENTESTENAENIEDNTNETEEAESMDDDSEDISENDKDDEEDKEK